MSEPMELLRRNLAGGLAGVVSHTDPRRALDGLDWRTAGRPAPDGMRSVFQLVAHMSAWQDWTLRSLARESPSLPGPDENWPPDPAPADADDWDRVRARFFAGLEALQAAAQESDLTEEFETSGEFYTRADAIRVIASHNSYHLGQLVLVRRALGRWSDGG